VTGGCPETRFSMKSPTASHSPDIVIVGGGTTGCVLAARLAERSDLSVWLIEAGPDLDAGSHRRPEALTRPETVSDPIYYWKYDGFLTSAHHEPVSVPRGRVLGGSGAINGTTFVRGLPGDYDWHKESGWDWPAALNAFRRLETDADFGGEVHGQTGPMPVRRHRTSELSALDLAFCEAAIELGFPEQRDLNLPMRHGVGPQPRNLTEDSRVDTSMAYLGPARHRPNLRIVDGAVAHRLVWDGTRAVGVVIERGGKRETIFAGDVILSCGAIGTPQLLVASGVGQADALSSLDVPIVADIPGVGTNLSDHPMVRLDLGTFSASASTTASLGTLVALYYTGESSESTSDMQLSLTWNRSHDGRSVSASICCLLNQATSRGRLRFAKRAGLYELAVHYDYLTYGGDVERLGEAVSIATELAQRLPMRTVLGVPHLPEWATTKPLLTKTLARSIGSAQHSMGTCKLGPSNDPMTVVDGSCRVHGTSSLRVVDLSIVPRVTRAASFATAVMLGERGAEVVLGKVLTPSTYAAAMPN
jgi:choline dehydrogenase